MKAIYKYVFNGEIIYIGQTRSSLEARITGHRNEERFSPYKGAKLYYFEVKNNTELDIFERLLINKYQPILNVNNTSADSLDIVFNEPEWELYKPVKKQIIRKGRPKGEDCVTRSLRIREDLNELLIIAHNETKLSYNELVNRALDAYLPE